MNKIRLSLLLILILLQSACLENLFSGNNDSSIFSLDSETTTSNSATSDSEIQSSSSSEDESSTTGDTELDSEGFASLPVTPPKVEIDALRLSAVNQTVGTNESEFYLTSAYATDDSIDTCYLNGEVGAAEAESTMIAGLSDSSETALAFVTAADGSFSVAVPDSLKGQSLWLRYQDDSSNDQDLSVMIAHDCNSYAVGISDLSLNITGGILVYNDFVFYNSEQSDGSNLIIKQTLTGSAPTVYAATTTELSQMYYSPGMDDVNGNSFPLMLGLDENFNLLSVTDAGVFTLNDYQSGEELPSGGVVNVDWANLLPSKNGAFSLYFRRASDADDSHLEIIPSVPEATDWSIDDGNLLDLNNFSMEWASNSDIMTFSVRSLVQSEGYGTTIEFYDVSALTNLSVAELIANNDTKTYAIDDPTRAYFTANKLMMPLAFQYGTSGQNYVAFNAEINGAGKLGITDFNRGKIISSIEGSIYAMDVSEDGLFMAVEVHTDDGDSIIILIHLPTMETASIVNHDEFTENISLHMPQFSNDATKHVMSYTIAHADGTTEVAVLDLEVHPKFSNWLELSVNQEDLAHVFSNQDYTDITFTDVMKDQEEEN